MRQLPGRLRNIADGRKHPATRARSRSTRCRSTAKPAMKTAAIGTNRALTSPCSSFSARIEPRPTPIANSASIIVTTCSLAKRTSFANTGRPETTIRPNSQNHDVARIGSSRLGRLVTCCTTSKVSRNKRIAGRLTGVRRRRGWDLPRRQPADDGGHDANDADDERAVGEERDAATEDRAEQNREERACLDQRVAGDELLFLQVLRQQRVLDRAEDRRVRAEAEQRGEQHRHTAPP